MARNFMCTKTDPVVETKAGKLRGFQLDGTYAFHGVKYADAKRFHQPTPVEPWEGIKNALAYGYVCPMLQQDQPSNELMVPHRYWPLDENCQYLNIWTQHLDPNAKKPVLVWLHGGGFAAGSSIEHIAYEGENMSKYGDVVVISLNHRLNILGYLDLSPFGEEYKNSGNAGNADMVAALQWIHENIANFGGDPENITVFGQSAGCMSVQTLVSSPLTENWISKAIFQSAGGYDTGLNRDMPLSEAETIGQEFVELTGAKTLEELRAIPAEKIVELQEEFGRVNPSRMLSFVPNIDNHLLTCGYNEAVTEGKIKDIPYMLGSTADDIGVFPEMKEKGEHGGIYKGCINWSLALEKLGRKPAYVYYFTRALLGDDAGAFHSSELWYMFGTLGRSWRPKTEGDYALSKEMMDDWTNFMKTGNPNAEGKDDWKPCTKDDPYVQVLDVRE